MPYVLTTDFWGEIMGAKYAIFRTEKLKSIGNIAGMLGHMTRSRPTPNSNGAENDILIQPPALAEIKKELSYYRPRKNAVLALDILLATSPDVFKDRPDLIKEWQRASLEWVQEHFGTDNVRACIGHNDESQPHLSALVIPDYRGRLCAAHYIGSRKKLRELQTSYARAVERFGLQRGIEGSTARHVAIKEYYAMVNAIERGEEAQREELITVSLEPVTMADRMDPASYAARAVMRAAERVIKANEIIKQLARRYKDERDDAKGKLDLYWRKIWKGETPTSYKEKIQTLEENMKDLRQENRALKDERDKDCKAAYLAGKEAGKKEFREVEAVYTEQIQVLKEQGQKYNDLLAAVKKFFRENIPAQSSLRLIKNLGDLGRMEELKEIRWKNGVPGQNQQEHTIN